MKSPKPLVGYGNVTYASVTYATVGWGVIHDLMGFLNHMSRNLGILAGFQRFRVFYLRAGERLEL
jgi:hypothetical protein